MSRLEAEESQVPEGTAEEARQALDDAAVAAWLEANPDFFVRHPDLTARLRLPHGPSGAVSLVERQTAVLRGQLETERRRLAHLIARAREFETLSGRLHALVLKVIAAPDMERLEAALVESLCKEFDAEEVTLKLFPVAAEADPKDPLVAAFLDFVDRKHALCGPLDGPRSEALFGEQAAKIQSAALIPVRAEARSGVLAVGSADPKRFAPDMGTEHLDRLGEVVGRKLAALDPDHA
jgi:uncharacterized protein YigA (DUF484 family)